MTRTAALLTLLAGCTAEPIVQDDPCTERALEDRPDETSEPQVHVIYMLPADGLDNELDTDGTLATSVLAWTAWLAEQTGGPTMRMDTHCEGQALDISFVTSQTDDVTLASTDPYIRDNLDAELVDLGFDAPNKLYAVYYDGSSNYSCGGGAWPPALIGRVGALYLQGMPPGAPPCADQPLGAGIDSPGYLEHAMLHELVHTLGYVAECAPNHHSTGHVSDDPTDLMYTGSEPWYAQVLDVGNDDYYGHGRADCPDLARSALLEPMPEDAELPPGW